jgi:hypothetical protein
VLECLQEAANPDVHGGQRQRRGGHRRSQPIQRPVAPAVGGEGIWTGVAVHLEDAIDEVENPVVGETGPGVEAALVTAVEGETADRRRIYAGAEPRT